MTLALQLFPRIGHVPCLNFLVSVLDHHHSGIDHGANGNGNPAQGHDVGVDALVAHDDKGNQHTNRQRDDRHQG